MTRLHTRTCSFTLESHAEQKRKGKKGRTLFCHHMCKTLRRKEKGKMGKGTLSVNTWQYCDETCFSQEGKHDIWTQTPAKLPCSSRRLSKPNPHVSPENFIAGLSLTCSFYSPQLQILGSLGAKASFEQQSSILLWKWLSRQKTALKHINLRLLQKSFVQYKWSTSKCTN